MITRDEFARVVEAFMGELSATCVSEDATRLKRFPEFRQHHQEVVAALRDPATRDDEMLGAAFGLIDEYVGAAWDEVIDEAYAFIEIKHRVHRKPEIRRRALITVVPAHHVVDPTRLLGIRTRVDLP